MFASLYCIFFIFFVQNNLRELSDHGSMEVKVYIRGREYEPVEQYLHTKYVVGTLNVEL